MVVPAPTIRCSRIECPDPLAWMKLMQQEVEVHHLVKFDDEGYTVQHPLRERAVGNLFDCKLHLRLGDESYRRDSEWAPGTYRVEWDPGAPDRSLNFELVTQSR